MKYYKPCAKSLWRAALSLSLLLAALFISQDSVHAATHVSGIISQDATWTKAEGPYVIGDYTEVRPGVTLTLEPGTVVKFDRQGLSQGMLFILGALKVRGTAEEKVVFTVMADDEAGGDTNGDGNATAPSYSQAVGRIVFSNASESYIDHALFRHLYWGISVSGSGVNFADIVYAHNGAGISFTNASQGSVERAVFEGNIQPAISVFAPAIVNVRESEFADSRVGVSVEGDAQVLAENNWWGDDSGPYHAELNQSGTGAEVSGNVDFVPWKGGGKEGCCSSVLFIPGFEASRLHVVQDGQENQLWEPNRNADAEKLVMNPDGTSKLSGVYASDIITRTNLPIAQVDIYHSFAQSLDGLVQQGVISEWADYPYDWRYDVRDVIAQGAVRPDGSRVFLADTVEELAGASKTGKVTLIGHSNGGLVAKALVRELELQGKAGLIDSIVLVATPQLGTAMAVPALLHGFGQEIGRGYLVRRDTARSLGEYMPGAYGLLPSDAYFSATQQPVIYFDRSIDTLTQYRALYGDAVTDRSTLQSFLAAERDRRVRPDAWDTIRPTVLADSLLNGSRALHAEIDRYDLPAHVGVYQLVGTGLDTVRATKYEKRKAQRCVRGVCSEPHDFIDARPLFSKAGDGTVQQASAAAIATTTYYINLAAYNAATGENKKHADILESAVAQEVIRRIIGGDEKLPPFVSRSVPNAGQDMVRASMHSPATLSLRDAEGRYVGLMNTDSETDLELTDMQIPNSYYLPFGEGVYIGAPLSASSTLTAIGTAEGTFTLELEIDTSGGEEKVVFADVPVVLGTEAVAGVSSEGEVVKMTVDLDGDAAVDLVVDPQGGFDVVQYLEELRRAIVGMDMKPNIKARLIQVFDALIKKAKAGKLSKAEKLIKKLADRIGAKHAKKQKISDRDAAILLDMLEDALAAFAR